MQLQLYIADGMGQVEAEGELMLIGVAAGSVRLLRNWGASAPVPTDDLDATEAAE